MITADLSSKSSKHQYPSVFPSNLARWSSLQSFIFSSRRGTSLGQHVLMASQAFELGRNAFKFFQTRDLKHHNYIHYYTLPCIIKHQIRCPIFAGKHEFIDYLGFRQWILGSLRCRRTRIHAKAYPKHLCRPSSLQQFQQSILQRLHL